MACVIREEESGIYIKFSGDVVPQDVVSVVDAMQGCGTRKYEYRISNWLEVRSFELSAVHVSHMISLDYVLDLKSPGLRKAVIATSPYLVAKFESWKAKSSGTDLMQLFSSEEEARIWAVGSKTSSPEAIHVDPFVSQVLSLEVKRLLPH